jgi:hypothetical protein
MAKSMALVNIIGPMAVLIGGVYLITELRMVFGNPTKEVE